MSLFVGPHDQRFLTRNWTRKELDSAIARETRTGDVHVIPILCADVQVCLEIGIPY